MKKICFLFSDLKVSNGVSRVAIAIANLLSQREDLDITLIALYEYEKEASKLVSPRVHTKKIFGFYFRGFDKLIDFVPHRLLYNNILKKGNYDVEIGFQYNIPTKIVAASTNQKAAHIAWMHGYDYGLKLRSNYSKLDKVICVSRCNSERLYKEMGGGVTTDYCYNPINDEIVAQNGRADISLKRNGDVVFISVGRHSPEKGYSRLLDIVSRLKEDGYKFKLWLVGDGPTHAELINQTTQLELKDFVVFVGAQKNPHKYTAKADVFVCSSFSEGYSTACTEAILLGIPVITTNVSGGEEIINESQAGLLTEMSDESLYEGMKKVLDHPELIQNWKNILQSTKQKFSQKERERKLNEIVDWAVELSQSKKNNNGR